MMRIRNLRYVDSAMVAETPIQAMPRSVGIIMDGNRRWARQYGMAGTEGHRAGAEKLKEVVGWLQELGIGYCYLYTFSTENWRRSEKERTYLFSIIREQFEEELERFRHENVRLHFLGHTSLFPDDVQEVVARAERETAANTGLTLNLCFGYGGRAEIVHAVNQLIARHGVNLGEITEDHIEQELWTAGMPHPDMIVRTGGEQRLSNFLTWQSIYSELFFTETYWPALSREEFDAILAEYHQREQRMGK